MQNPNLPPGFEEEQPQNVPGYYGSPYGANEQDITNIVAQIDPKTIIDNLDHALKGEHFNKERGEWIMNASKKPMVNDSCRSAIISYLDGILTNNTTMGNIDERRLSFLMESIIDSINRMFISNLEEFGFVESITKRKLVRLNKVYFLKTDNELEELKSNGIEYETTNFDYNQYENKGTPDSSRMTLVSNMIYKICFLVFTRALKGQESIRIFKSLSMNDAMMYGGQPPQKTSLLGKLFGR